MRALAGRISPSTLAVVAGVALLPCLVPDGPFGATLVPDRWLTIGVLAAAYSMLALGLVVAMGWAGQFLLGYAAFFAIGAYTYGLLNSFQTEVHLGVLLTVPIAVAACVTFAGLIGIPTLRLRGDYFALVSLASGEVVRLAIVNLPDVTGGNAGLVGVDPLTLLPDSGGAVIDDTLVVYAAGWVVVGLLACALWWVRRTPLGRTWIAVREDEEAARSVGVRPLRAKLSAVMVAAALAGIAGCFFAASQLALAPSSFGLVPLFVIVAGVVLGGMGSLGGAIIGTWVLLGVPELVRDAGGGGDALLDYRLLIYGTALLGIILLRPGGLLPEIRLGFADSLGEESRSPPLSGATLELDGLSAGYGGVKALNKIDLHMQPGELVGVIGANGSGKTTLLNVISGFHPATGGRILLDGEEIGGKRPERRALAGVARTFQMNRLFEGASVAENVRVAAERKSGRAAAAARRAKAELAAFPDRFPSRRWRELPGSLSYANRRRLEMARARCVQPSLLLLDEPTAGMNPVDRGELLRQVRDWADEGSTVLVVEHQLAELAEVSDRLVALDHGEIIAIGQPADVLATPAVIAALTSLEPTIQAT